MVKMKWKKKILKIIKAFRSLNRLSHKIILLRYCQKEQKVATLNIISLNELHVYQNNGYNYFCCDNSS